MTKFGNNNRRAVKTMVATFGLLLMASCGAEGDPTVTQPGDTQNTITLSEAVRKADQYSTSALDAISQGHARELQEKRDDFPCSNADGSPSPNLRQGSLSYEIKDVSPETLNAVKTSLQDWWKNNGFSTTGLTQTDQMASAENKSDGFTSALQTNKVGKVYLLTSSPCVWRNGTPESK